MMYVLLSRSLRGLHSGWLFLENEILLLFCAPVGTCSAYFSTQATVTGCVLLELCSIYVEPI